MDITAAIVVLVTIGSDDEGRRVAQALLARHQAACVNIIPGLTSLYWWQGKIEESTEHMLVIKTRASRLEDVVGTVRETHSYAVPEILALPVIGSDPDYLAWLLGESS